MSDFKKLLESSDLLDESTKQVLKEEFDTAIEAKTTEMKADYDRQLEESRKEMSELLPQLVEEALSEELGDVAEELSEARQLEVQYAERLETFKESYDTKAREMIDIMVAEAVAEEVEELQEDIDLAKKHQFALAITEAFGQTWQRMFGESDFDKFAEMEQMSEELENYKRKEKVAELTEGLQGQKLRVAEAILENVAVERMEAKFESIRSYLTENVSEEKDDKQNLNESDDNQSADDQVSENSTVVLENAEEATDGKSTKATSRGDALIQRSLR